MRFITFSGVDGSGKSTQLGLLREQLEREGKKVAYFHAIEFSVASRLKKQVADNSQQKTEKANTSASWCTIFLRKIQLLIDLIRFRFYFAKLRREGYDYLLSDRYFFDTIINIEYLEGSDSFLLSNICSLISAPDTALYFNASPQAIMSRDRAPEQGIEYLRTKQSLFKDKLSDWNMITIDANRDKEAIFQDIKNLTN